MSVMPSDLDRQQEMAPHTVDEAAAHRFLDFVFASIAMLSLSSGISVPARDPNRRAVHLPEHSPRTQTSQKRGPQRPRQPDDYRRVGPPLPYPRQGVVRAKSRCPSSRMRLG